MLCFSFGFLENPAAIFRRPQLVKSRRMHKINAEVIWIMFTDPTGPMPIFPLFLAEDGSTGREFLSLPEETQQLLLKKGADSGEDMAKQIKILKEKE